VFLRSVARPTEADVQALADFPASFTTDTVYAVDVSATGFTLVEQPVAPPLHKRYDLVAAYRDGDPRWDVLLLAEDSGRTVGVAATTCHPWNARQVLDEIHVAPDLRRQGVARALLAEVVGIARRNGAREVWAETQNVNVPAVRAYRRLGFRLSGLDTTLYPGPTDETALFLSLPVAPSG
jgi:ribosomal protein S18 acetylase RimI-like enzyme